MELITKITLLGPAPFGGSHTSEIDSPTVEKLMHDGYTVYRIWRVVARSLGGILIDEIYHA